MFCPKCGNKISDGIKFCPECGTEISPQEDAQAFQMAIDTVQGPVATETLQDPGAASLAEVVGKNTEYYLPEFKKVERGEKTRFNWNAFVPIFAVWFCFYRKSGDIFKKYLLLPVIAILIVSGVYAIGIASFNTVLIIIGDIVYAAAELWGLINRIRLCKNFNKEYYSHCKQVAATKDEKKYGTSFGAGAIATIVYVFIVQLSSALSTGAFNARV